MASADHLGHSGTETAKVYVDRYNARNDRVASALAAYTAGRAAPPARLGKNKGVRARADA